MAVESIEEGNNNFYSCDKLDDNEYIYLFSVCGPLPSIK